jgi:hypothetical protein
LRGKKQIISLAMTSDEIRELMFYAIELLKEFGRLTQGSILWLAQQRLAKM